MLFVRVGDSAIVSAARMTCNMPSRVSFAFPQRTFAFVEMAVLPFPLAYAATATDLVMMKATSPCPFRQTMTETTTDRHRRTMLLGGIDSVKYLLGVYFGLDFLGSENLFDDAFFVYEIRSTQDADGVAATSYLLAPTAELLQQGGLSVGNEREVQAVGIGKLLLESLFVLAYADNLVAGGSQLFLVRLQRTGFGCASAGVGFGIAVKHYFATAIVARFNFVSVLVYAKNLWNFISYSHGCGVLGYSSLTKWGKASSPMWGAYSNPS